MPRWYGSGPCSYELAGSCSGILFVLIEGLDEAPARITLRCDVLPLVPNDSVGGSNLGSSQRGLATLFAWAL